jgi:Gas vesicle synthesis protein GvpL/GvpF
MTASKTRDSEPVYVYGVVPAGIEVSVADPGVAGRPIELLEHDAVAAVVSSFPNDDARVRRSDLLAHLRTLERVFEQATLAPCPFGTIIGSRRDVEEAYLAPRHEELRRLLDRLDGHVQLNVKAEYREEALLREIVAEDSAIASARQRAKALGSAAYYENLRLGELVAGRIAQKRATDARRIAAHLSPHSADFVSDVDDRTELLVFKGSYLVRREQNASFDSALDELARSDAERLRFEAIGPLPPTAFATLEQEPGWV